MIALRQVAARIFNPPPGPEAQATQRTAERLSSAADDLAEHHDALKDLVKRMRSEIPARRKLSKRARG